MQGGLSGVDMDGLACMLVNSDNYYDYYDDGDEGKQQVG